MRFIKTGQIRVKDTVLFARDQIQEISAKIVEITRQGQGWSFRFSYPTSEGREYDSVEYPEDARCLLIRRPSERRKASDDVRDHINTSVFLSSLSNGVVAQVARLSHTGIREGLREHIHPFSRLSKKTCEKLRHVPTRWVQQGAQWLLDERLSRRK